MLKLTADLQKLMKIILRNILLLLILATSLAAQEKPEKPYIVTTTGIVADIVKNVAGDLVQLEALMGPGVDPHLYKSTQGDLKRLLQADIVFYNGLKLEGKMQEIFEKLARKKPVIPVSREIDRETLLAFAAYPGEKDPHIWFDVLQWSLTISVVRDELTRLLPEHKAVLFKNAKNYKQELEELAHWVKEQVALVPAEQRVLVTAHDAFHYFGRAYGFEVLGLQGISTESEFGLQDIKRISDVIISRKVKAIFVETSVPEKFIRSLEEGVREQGFEVSVGGALFSDAMGNDGTPEGTYIGMVKHNVSTIVEGLK